MLKGIGASSGIAIGKALIVSENKAVVERMEVEDTAGEEEKLNKAVEVAKAEIEALYKNTLEKMGSEKAEIFEAHLFLLDGPDLVGDAKSRIRNEKVNVEYAMKAATENLAILFEGMGNPYMAERAADIRDIGKRVVGILAGKKGISIAEIQEECILVAKDLAPSDTAQIDKNYILGYVTETGGRTSHSAIIARSMEIPAVVGMGAELSEVEDGDLLILDGEAGAVIVNPKDEILEEYRHKKEEYTAYRELLQQIKDAESVTLDGRRVELFANIGTPEDMDKVLASGAEGIGLFRTEFLYMAGQCLPTEDEQFEAYKTVVERMAGKPVIIRTLDIGGDKEVPYLALESEMNPFLGYRAIRLCLNRQDLFKAQLRALLRASMYGDLRIMFPMISTLQELRQAKAVLEECREALRKEGQPSKEDIQIGIMIEVPSAALISDLLAKEVDFFSIGTNDLIQYTVAVDRMNEKVSYLYSFFNPAVLRLIKMVIDNAHKEGKYVGMCGEMAGNRELLPVLLGMGLDEFSMSPSSILTIRNAVRHSSYEGSKELADEVVQLGSSDEIEALIKKQK